MGSAAAHDPRDESVVLVGVTRAPDLAADLATRVQRRVHVGVAEASPDHLQDGREIARGYALSSRPEHVRRDDGPRNRAGSGGRTRRFSAAPAEEEADTAAHPALTEVDVRNERRCGEVLVGELELDPGVVVQDLHFVGGAPGGENGGHLLGANQVCAEAHTLVSRGSERGAKQYCRVTKRSHEVLL